MTQKDKVLVLLTDGTWPTLGHLLRDRLPNTPAMRVVAEQLGINPSTLYRVSRGSEPDLYTFGLLWHWLGVRIEGVRVVE